MNASMQQTLAGLPHDRVSTGIRQLVDDDARRIGAEMDVAAALDEWYTGPGGKELVAFGHKPADHDQSAFQRIHALSPLILVDCGVPKSIFDAVDALATNSNARVLAIGNPDDPASHFAQICTPGSGWHVITISAFDMPAHTDEKVPEGLLPLWFLLMVGGARDQMGGQQSDRPILR